MDFICPCAEPTRWKSFTARAWRPLPKSEATTKLDAGLSRALSLVPGVCRPLPAGGDVAAGWPATAARRTGRQPGRGRVAQGGGPVVRADGSGHRPRLPGRGRSTNINPAITRRPLRNTTGWPARKPTITGCTTTPAPPPTRPRNSRRRKSNWAPPSTPRRSFPTCKPRSTPITTWATPFTSWASRPPTRRKNRSAGSRPSPITPAPSRLNTNDLDARNNLAFVKKKLEELKQQQQQQQQKDQKNDDKNQDQKNQDQQTAEPKGPGPEKPAGPAAEIVPTAGSGQKGPAKPGPATKGQRRQSRPAQAGPGRKAGPGAGSRAANRRRRHP